MGNAARQIEPGAQPTLVVENAAETGFDAESRLLAELQVQREIVNNFRKENRRLTMLTQHLTMQNNDLNRELGMLNAHMKNLPSSPAPLMPCQSKFLEQVNHRRMLALQSAVRSGLCRLDTPAFDALGHLGDLLVRAIRDEDVVAAMQFQMSLSAGDPECWTSEGSARDIACAALDMWIERKAPETDPEP